MPPKAPTALHAHCVPSLRCPPAWAWALAGLAAGGAPSWAQSPAISATQLPQGGKVVAGTASINQSGNNLQINQSSNRAVLDWNSFNVGAQAQVNFAQPSASSVTLNRVLDTQASQIMGRITANGQVFLTNPNGVLFGPTAQVDVGGLLVTTHGIGNDDFMAGKSSFEGAGAAGSVVNQGQLQASLGGYIAMLAPLVRNEGVIVAKEGTVALAAGDKITLQFAGQSLTAVQVDRAVMDALVDNQHLVRAEGGYVVMTARSANALLQNVVKNTGSVQAPSLVNRQGRIVLEGGSLGRVEVAGSLSATGDSGQSGGSVVVMGDQVQLSSGARIDASGDTGGGQVLIGGGWGAQVGPVGKSSSVSVGEGVNIKAAATGTGNGGYVETSAQKVQIAASARVDTSAANGKAGQWVIDPVDITIDDSLASAISSALGSGDVTVSTDGNNTPNTIAGESSGTGNININSPITWSANMLTLRAADKIFINQILRGSGSAHLRFALPDPGGLDKIFLKAPTYLAEGDNASFLFPGTGVVSIKVITRLGLSGSVSGLDLQGINGNLSGVYFLGDDIDASATSTWQGGAGFMPLGNNATPFSGSFFGGGHTIRNLTINRPADDAVGLLGNSMGSASEVGLINASVTGANHVGALVGRLSGPGSVSTSFSTGTVRGQTSVGGLVGTLDGSGEVRNSYAKANVSVYNFADAGGLIGLVNAGTVYKTYATGAVTVVGSGPSSGIGGLIGRLGSGGSGALDVVHAGFWDTTLSGQSTSAAGIGLATAATQRFNNGLDQFELNPNYWQNYYNKTTPLLAAFLTPITVNAGSDSKTYDGRAYTSNTGFSTSISVSGSDPYFLGGGDYYYKQGTTRVSPVNAGSYSIVPDLYSSDNRGYNITVVNGTLTVNPADVSLSGSRVYDGSTAMAGANLTATGVNGETFRVTGSGASGNLASKQVQTAQPLASVNGLSLGTSDNGGLSSNYHSLSTANSSVTVTPKAVTLTAPVASKTYDATTAYTPSASQLSELSRQLGVDGDSVSGIGLSFNNKNAAIGTKVLSASGAIISDGNGGQNYSISYASNSNSTINPKSLAVTGLIANSKSYDGTTDVNLSGTATIAPLAGDSVSLQSGSAQFLRPTEGSNVPVTASGFQISGADAANYQLVQPAGLSAHITPMDLTATRISLSPAAMTTLTRPQLALLSPDQVGYLSTAQLSALSPAQLSYLNPSVWSRVSTSSLGSLTNDQIASLTASAWSYWLASQVRALSPSQLQAISASQMAGWTRTQLQALDISQWVQISDLTRQSLSAAQIETLTPAQIGNWPRNILNDLSESQWAGLGVRQIAGMTRDQISAMSPSRLALWSSAQLSALSAVQMAWMSMAQINALNPTQLRVLADNGLLQYVVGDDASRVQVSNTVTGNAQSSTQLSVSNSDAASSSSVSATTLSASSTSRQSSNTQALMVVTSERQISQLSGQQVQSLSVAQLRLMNGTQLDALVQSHSRALLATQWASLSAQQLASLSPSVWASLGRDVLQSLSAQQLSLLTLSQVQAMRAEQLQALSVAQLEVFNRVALSALSETQFKALVSNKLAALSSEQIQSISTAQWLSLSRSQIQSLTLQQIQSLSAAQLSAMSAAQWQSLSAEQVQMLVPQNLTNVNVAQLAIVLKWLNPSQISALDPRTVAQFSVPLLTSLSPLQWAALQAQQIAALSLAQLNALSPTQFRSLGSTALTELSAQQIASLSPALLSALSRVQWQSLSPSQLQGLQSSQLAALSVAQLESLGPQVLQALAPNQLVGLSLAQLQVVQAASGNWPVQAMSPAQINAMDAAQVQALSVDSIGLLTPPQIAAFNALQL
ncbi:MAG: filamentous hemagglutinin N-terminal domain-containing protein, partial [Betaproteobacteria bacterium]|nr:filamentous hemagglutinin N-terminal domain-containing protein [Betaproteobacteria bacterium]